MRKASVLPLVALLALYACGGDDAALAPAPAPPTDTPPDTSTPSDDGSVLLPGVDYAIVAADSLKVSAEHFKTYREGAAGGAHKVSLGLLSSIAKDSTDRASIGTKVHDWVKARFDQRDTQKPFFLLIVGDATADEPVDPTKTVPAPLFADPRTTEKIITDNLFADMDGDHVPDLAIGRIPVSLDAEADAILEKTKRFESTYEVGPWNRRLSLFASTAGFTPEIDQQIESLVFKMVEEIPYDFDINLTYAKQSSPYVFIPEKFSDKVYERINEGSLMMTYVGHGNTDSFASLSWNGGTFPILDTKDLAKINIAHRPPLLTLIACLTGRFTDGESLSEKILKSQTGPVGIFSSTEVSDPYANAVFIRELAQVATVEKAATVGEMFVRAKKRSMTNKADALRQDIDNGAGSIYSPKVRDALLLSHLYMYTLFGDPAAHINYVGKPIAIELPKSKPTPNSDLVVNATFEGLGSGNAIVTLETLRSIISAPLKPVPADGANNTQRDAIIAENYATANDPAIVKVMTAKHAAGKLTATLKLPAVLPAGDYYVKVYADDGAKDAIGSAKLVVTP